jgi:hypothetical protein
MPDRTRCRPVTVSRRASRTRLRNRGLSQFRSSVPGNRTKQNGPHRVGEPPHHRLRRRPDDELHLGPAQQPPDVRHLGSDGMRCRPGTPGRRRPSPGPGQGPGPARPATRAAAAGSRTAPATRRYGSGDARPGPVRWSCCARADRPGVNAFARPPAVQPAAGTPCGPEGCGPIEARSGPPRAPAGYATLTEGRCRPGTPGTSGCQ